MQEIWKDIKNYEGKYQVSNYGNVRSLNFRKTGLSKNLKLVINHNGYVQVGLFNKSIKSTSVHRLVTEAFLDKIEGKEDINHKDGNKKNNHVNNLEWCNQKENSIHAAKTGLIVGNYKIILQYDKNGNFIKEHLGSRAAARELGLYNTNIIQCCKGVLKTTGGFIFKYKENE